MRTVFVLIGLAALAAWWVRSEMLAEQRREELIEAFSKSPNQLSLRPNDKPTWKQRLIARLRGKEVPPVVVGAHLNRIDDVKAFREFNKTFNVKLDRVQTGSDKLTPELLEALAECKSISFLNIQGKVDGTDETLSRLAKIRLEKGFTLWEVDVDDAFLKRLADAGVGCGQIAYPISSPDGPWFRVTDEGLRSAARLPKLETLSANRNAGEAGLAAFRNHPTLTEVALYGSGYTPKCGEILATLPKLNRLTLIDTQWPDEAVAAALEGHSLFALKLHNVQIGEKTEAAIANLKMLLIVELKNVPLTPELAAALAKSPVQDLTIEGDYDDSVIARFAPLAPSLMTFSLSSPSTTDAGVAWLDKAAMLLNLRLPDTSITAAPLLTLPRRTTTSHLTLGGSNIDGRMLAELQKLPGLSGLTLHGESIDDEALSALPGTITSLDLYGTRVTAKGLKAIAQGDGKIAITMLYAEGTTPPCSEKEIEELNTTTRMSVRLLPVSETTYRELLPKSSRKD